MVADMLTMGGAARMSQCLADSVRVGSAPARV